MLVVTSFYSVILAFFFSFLSLRTIVARRKAGISLGVHESPDLLRKSRVHANFAEYVPFTLLLMGLSEIGGASVLILHLSGMMLLIGRVLHWYGVDREKQKSIPRIVAMQFTLFAITLLAFTLMYQLMY